MLCPLLFNSLFCCKGKLHAQITGEMTQLTEIPGSVLWYLNLDNFTTTSSWIRYQTLMDPLNVDKLLSSYPKTIDIFTSKLDISEISFTTQDINFNELIFVHVSQVFAQ